MTTASGGCNGNFRTAGRREERTMSCTSVSHEAQWASTVDVDSAAIPGVRYAVRRMSLGRRNELIRRVRELAQKAEFHAAGESTSDRLRATELALEIDATYIRWGLT